MLLSLYYLPAAAAAAAKIDVKLLRFIQLGFPGEERSGCGQDSLSVHCCSI